jgi:type II secretory pathway pseudopilin PulG
LKIIKAALHKLCLLIFFSSVLRINLYFVKTKCFSKGSRKSLSNGFSLFEVIATIGISAILMSAFASIITLQQFETRALKEKFTIHELTSTLTTALNDQDICDYALKNPGSLVLNTTDPSLLDTTKFEFQELHSTNDPASPLMVHKNGPLFTDTPSVVVTSIYLTNFAGSKNKYTANWVINFDQSLLARHLHNIVIPVSLTLDTLDPVAAVIESCTANNGQKHGRKLYDKPGSYVFIVPDGITELTVDAVAGGGGGGSSKTSRNAGGGASGMFLVGEKFIVKPGDNLVAVVGAGGASGYEGGDGGQGTYTRVGTCCLNQGYGGMGSTRAATMSLNDGDGGAGGYVTYSNCGIPWSTIDSIYDNWFFYVYGKSADYCGTPGTAGEAGNASNSGAGGSNYFGNGGVGMFREKTGYNVVGVPGSGFGSGGGGASNGSSGGTSLGGKGADGFILIQW